VLFTIHVSLDGGSDGASLNAAFCASRIFEVGKYYVAEFAPFGAEGDIVRRRRLLALRKLGPHEPTTNKATQEVECDN
jgi:hypothetical protein